MKPITIHREAQVELDETIGYYERQQEGLGKDFQAEVEQATARIQQHPQLGTPYKATRFRRYVIQRFPYSVFYIELDKSIWIVAIAHAKRRPDYWTRRRIK